jgi:hypothetical protein
MRGAPMNYPLVRFLFTAGVALALAASSVDSARASPASTKEVETEYKEQVKIDQWIEQTGYDDQFGERRDPAKGDAQEAGAQSAAPAPEVAVAEPETPTDEAEAVAEEEEVEDAAADEESE